MAIGPISALRPVSMTKRLPEDPDLSRVVEVEHMDKPKDDEYTPADQQASRGLEDEEKEGQSSAELDALSGTDTAAKTVSLFA